MDPVLTTTTLVLAIAERIPSIMKLLLSLPPVRESDKGDLSLNAPGERLATGVRKLDNELVPTIFVENSGGKAYEEAKRASKDANKKVLVEVLGTAHSAQPTSKSDSSVKGLRPGVSVCHEDSYAGTLGAFVRFRYTSKKGEFKGFTSASHVLACDGAEQGSHIVRPGRPEKSPDIDDRIATLARSIHLTHYTAQNQVNAIVNATDIGVAQLNLPLVDEVSNNVPDPKKPAEIKALCAPMNADELISHLEMPVFMIGRSGFNEGILHATGVQPCSLKIGNRIYLYGDVSIVRPVQGASKPFCQPGDSGAVVYSADGRLLGFIVGGAREKGLFHSAHACLTAVDAQLI